MFLFFLPLEQAFDIDGVLVRGQGVLPGARESLKALEDARVPFVFVTNGGGERYLYVLSVAGIPRRVDAGGALVIHCKTRDNLLTQPLICRSQ